MWDRGRNAVGAVLAACMVVTVVASACSEDCEDYEGVCCPRGPGMMAVDWDRGFPTPDEALDRFLAGPPGNSRGLEAADFSRELDWYVHRSDGRIDTKLRLEGTPGDYRIGTVISCSQ